LPSSRGTRHRGPTWTIYIQRVPFPDISKFTFGQRSGGLQMTQDEMNDDRKKLYALWDGYEKQEEELKAARSMLKDMEAREKEKDRIIATLRELMETKDTQLRKFELASASNTDKMDDLQTRIRELDQTLTMERSRYKKLYYLTEELDQEVNRLRKGIEERDNWFKDNLSFLEEMPDRIRKWKEIVGRTSVRKTLLDALAPEGDAKIEPPPPQEMTFQKVDAREEVIGELSSISGLDETKAIALYDAGYTSLDKLRSASPFDLVKIEQINPTIARKIAQHFKA